LIGVPNNLNRRVAVRSPGPTLATPTLPVVLFGLHEEARKPLLELVDPSRINLTVHNRSKSAGTHLPDEPRSTTAAIDLNVNGLSDDEIRALLEAMGRKGFAAWFRDPGQDGWPAKYGPHIHAI
jgi:hypothetical protein